MATKPSVSQVAAGSKATASQWNNGPYQIWNFIDNTRPICQVYQGTTATQSIANNTFTSCNMDTEIIDTDGQHDNITNNSRITIGKTLGWYRVYGSAAFVTNGTGSRAALIKFNGTTIIMPSYQQHAASGASFFSSAHTNIVYVQSTVNTDYVELQIWQNSGAALLTNSSGGTTASYLTAEWISL